MTFVETHVGSRSVNVSVTAQPTSRSVSSLAKTSSSVWRARCLVEEPQREGGDGRGGLVGPLELRDQSLQLSVFIGGPPRRQHVRKGGALVEHVRVRLVLHQHESVHRDQPDAGELVPLLGSPARRKFLGGQAHQVRDGIGMTQLGERGGGALAIGVRTKISRMGAPDQGVDDLVDDGRRRAPSALAVSSVRVSRKQRDARYT